MRFLEKLWTAIREPIEEAAKAVIAKLFVSVKARPERLVDYIPGLEDDQRREFRASVKEWLAKDPENRGYVIMLLEGAERLAMSGAEQINPTD
ncbi:MAG: hypothetical protein GF320_14295 [Armatimonadia bacterium]|nr:hypothetical protein [Armatimonadia bacterium]